MKKARFKIPGPVLRGFGRFFRWAGITLVREGIEIATRDREPVAKIKSGQVVLDGRFRKDMLKPEGLAEIKAEIRRIRGQQL